jgi:hypothetical protein
MWQLRRLTTLWASQRLLQGKLNPQPFLFKEFVSSSDDVVLRDRMMSEWQTGGDVKGSDGPLILHTVRLFTGMIEEKQEEIQSGQPIC